MRATRLFFATYRDLPDDFDSVSHRLLVKSGMIQQVAGRIFNYLPLGRRAIQKIRRIINEEMVAIDAQEVNMPVVQPAELWEQSGRMKTFIPPLSRFEDRRGRLMVLAPTHEETTSLMARAVIKSYRDLPKRLYHIQTKFRDELRSRGGLLRTREFEMKDAYSFDADQRGLDAAFEAMGSAYEKIFARCKTDTIRVDADSGGIGGKESSEFVMLVDGGEDVVLSCDNPKCDYAANREKAVFKRVPPQREEPTPMEELATPGVETIDALTKFAKVGAERTAKAVFYSIDGAVMLVVIRGDYDINETKLKNSLNAADVRLAAPDEVAAAQLTPGYTSPVGIDARVKVVADESVVYSPNLIGGANKPGYHIRNTNYARDYKAALEADIAQAKAGELCVLCGGVLIERRGIEVGHIFKLGSVYSETMDVRFQDANGKQQPTLMGCYGIGLGRLLAAVIEANHDENGIIFPSSVAPFDAHLLELGGSNPQVAEQADQVYNQLRSAGLDVLYDDRPLAAGVKFTDADLLGFPVRALISKRSVASQTVEVKARRSGEVLNVGLADLPKTIKSLLEKA